MDGVQSWPGLSAVALLGSGRHGEVWRAVEVGTGTPVAVRAGRRPREPLDEQEALRQARLITALRRVESEHVVRLRRVLDLPGGRRVLVCDLAAGGSLTSLVRRSGGLGAGQVVTLAAGLARGLADVHAAGLVHGAFGAGSVVLGGDGRPLVADLGVQGLLADAGEADPAEPPDDVLALGVLVEELLPRASTPDDPVRQALQLLADRCGEPEPALRPAAAEVVQLAVSAGPGEPLLPDVLAALREQPPPPPIAPAPGSAPLAARVPVRVPVRLPSSPAGIGAAALAVGALTLGAAAWAAGADGGADGAPSGPVLAPSRGPAPQEDLAGALEQAAAARAAAFSRAVAGPLALADAPGSPALAEDTAFVQRLTSRGVRLHGLSFAVDRVRVISRAGDEARVSAVVSASAHEQVPVRGGRGVRVAAAAPRTVELVLVRSPAGRWQVRAVTG